MTTSKLTFTPQINDKKLTGVYISSLNEGNNIDVTSFNSILDELNAQEEKVSITIKVDLSMMLDSDFISSLSKKNYSNPIYLEFEIPNNINKILLEQIDVNIKRMKDIGIFSSLHYSEYNRLQIELISSLSLDQINFASNLIDEIDQKYFKYKYLKYLNDIAISFGIKKITFNGVNTQKLRELTLLINENSSVQGSIYKNSNSLHSIIDNYTPSSKEIDSNNNNDSEWLIYNYIKSNHQSKVLNNIIPLLPAYNINGNEQKILKNLMTYHHADKTEIQFFIFNVLKNSERIFALRNSDGVVLFENKSHENFFGRSLIGVPVKDVISIVPDYSLCIDDDKHLLNSAEMFSVKKEIVNNQLYFTIRQKVLLENKVYISVTVYEENKGLFIGKDNLTGCRSRDCIKGIEKSFFYENKVLAFIDLNGFKKINDGYGHDIGDSVLVEFSEIMQSHIRSDTQEDIIVRYGGDEFIIFFNTNDLEQINIKLKQINQYVKNHFDKKGFRLSFSYGLSINLKNNVDNAIKIADQSMYIEKRLFKED
ncbi:GGDEF domain-containing protein [Aliivibrio sp. S4TY2]|uniref:diguanylate cyclase n=1 Tax=Aliivibrio finisterrensis TaxID=511998 RepID=A0A4Q5KUN1_9GAMM|nr:MULTISPECIES: GGDEF domain-containing protein [Aliivibrio]MDD9157421.1 GGDEF domain-containing protein [Aliivibrio sp. S4TY2]MDD9161385.1 GGDEF domain-containing protein [Aliivibrio sp. S4TY1]MDD9165415.1 GGDEF domain-containing protein [Aliivibrio sp. S4MY2]MDD9169330.1 GGDEF domain-containing protein [Aliivibrio sp. S4MY4]MDD9179812.1 GGDEF domain-containing protein [Aliivibrio sp. A6]